MCHDGCDVIFLLAVAAEILLDGGPGVEGVEECPVRELRNASQPAFRQHFVRHRRVCYVCPAESERGLGSGRAPGFIDLLGYVVGNHCAQVACVNSVPAGQENVPHVPVDLIDSGNDRGEKAASGHYDVDVRDRDSLVPEEADDGIPPHPVLVHYILVSGQFLHIVDEFLVEDLFSVNEISQLCAGAPRVDGQEPAFGDFLCHQVKVFVFV